MRSRGIDGWLGVVLMTFGAAIAGETDGWWLLFVVVTAVYVALNVRASRHEARRRGEPKPGPVDVPLSELLDHPKTARHARRTR